MFDITTNNKNNKNDDDDDDTIIKDLSYKTFSEQFTLFHSQHFKLKWLSSLIQMSTNEWMWSE